MAELHCWKDYREFVEEHGHECPSDPWIQAFMNPATCMLERDHDGEHEWTPDCDVTVEFAEASDA